MPTTPPNALPSATTAQQSTTRLRALRIDPHSSQLELVDAARLADADRVGIAETGYRSMTLCADTAMLVDEQAGNRSEPLNVWATVVTHTFTSTTVVFGSALVFGIGFDDRSMRTATTLQDAQVRRLASAIVGPLDLGVFERLTESLKPFPGALTYLANIGTRSLPEPADAGADARSHASPATARPI